MRRSSYLIKTFDDVTTDGHFNKTIEINIKEYFYSKFRTKAIPVKKNMCCHFDIFIALTISGKLLLGYISMNKIIEISLLIKKKKMSLTQMKYLNGFIF